MAGARTMLLHIFISVASLASSSRYMLLSFLEICDYLSSDFFQQDAVSFNPYKKGYLFLSPARSQNRSIIERRKLWSRKRHMSMR
jgi:hypothetical protein